VYKIIVHNNRFSVSVLGNGIVSGLVVICASCDCVTPFGSFIIGILGGITYQTLSRVLIKFKIDDPLDAIPVNGGCGVIGVLSVGFFHVEKGILYGDSGRLLAI
jgi:Amt family ammonium transporter